MKRHSRRVFPLLGLGFLILGVTRSDGSAFIAIGAASTRREERCARQPAPGR